MNGRTNSHGSTIDDLQVPLDPCTNFRAEAGNGSVTLYWDDPVDKYATPEGETAQNPQQLVSVWDHTTVVRKVGSQPANPNDGIIVTSSGVRDQYLSTGYMDTELINDTTYHYGVFAYNVAGVASDGVFTSATPIEGTPLGNLEVGTVVKTSIDGTPTEFLIVHQGKPGSMYDDSCDGTWLLMKDIYEQRQWNSSNSNDYARSTIHSYLNNAFLGLFDPAIQAAIKQVKIPYRAGSGPSEAVTSGANGLSCKIFLLSATELSFDHERIPTNEGAELSYFAGCADINSDSRRVAYLNSSATRWWLRSPRAGYSAGNYVSFVAKNGTLGSYSYSSSYGIRPALVLPPNTCGVDDGLNILAPVAKIAV